MSALVPVVKHDQERAVEHPEIGGSGLLMVNGCAVSGRDVGDGRPNHTVAYRGLALMSPPSSPQGVGCLGRTTQFRELLNS